MGSNFGRVSDGTQASVAGRDGAGFCTLTVHVSDTSVLCTTPPKSVTDAHAIVSVGGQSSRAIVGLSDVTVVNVPAYYACKLDFECQVCCLSRCQLAAMEAGIATGRTHAECSRECYTYCRSMLRQPTAPRFVRIGPTAPTGSSIPLEVSIPYSPNLQTFAATYLPLFVRSGKSLKILVGKEYRNTLLVSQ